VRTDKCRVVCEWPVLFRQEARYRNSISKAEFLKPGRIYAYTIDLWHTGMTIQPGHRLRIEVASAGLSHV